MPLRDQIMQMAAGNPVVAKAVSAMEAQLATTPVVPEDLDETIKLMEFVLQNPDKYQEVRAAAIKDGLIREEMAPPQFDKVFIISMLIALYALQDRMAQRMARGGLASAARRIATGGRGGDTELVHVNRREAEMLRRMGGAGTVNPNTGLREYKGIGSIIGSVLPVALGVIAPGIGSILGGAIAGGVSSGLSGGNIMQGVAMGGLGGALGGALGGGGTTTSPSDAVVGNMADVASATAPSGGLMDVASATAPSGGLVSAPSVSLTSAAAPSGGWASAAAPSSGLEAFANEPLVVVPPSNLADVARQQSIEASARQASLPYAIGNNVQNVTTSTGESFPAPGTPMINPTTGQPGVSVFNPKTGEIGYSPTTERAFRINPDTNTVESYWKNIAAPTKGSDWLSKAVLGASALSALTSKPEYVPPEINKLSLAQQDYFNRPSIKLNWTQLQQDANAANQSLGDYISKNWNDVSSGKYNLAQGGALSRYARGSGSGRDDTIDARLSDGEYVIDAETVALLGDGSSEEGARRLDQMRSNIRSHKGKALAKGKFSPNAKSPLTYIKESV